MPKPTYTIHSTQGKICLGAPGILQGKILKLLKPCKYYFVYNYYGVKIVLKIFSLFSGHFCFAMVYAKTIIHLGVGE
jgi:hypothetical protein